MLKFPVYLDYNATTPADPRVVESMLPFFTIHFGNAASKSHSYGWQAEEAVEKAREQVAGLIGAEPREIIFTSSATESDNLALKGAYDSYASKGNHIITLATEHKAVLDACRHLEREGAEITVLPVKNDGLADLQLLEAAIKPTTILIAVMYANNETGVIQPIPAIGRLARKHNILFFSDAAQAVGKIPVNVNDDHIDLLAISGHKLYAPKGIGALYVRRKGPRVRLTAQIDGGGHERGFRSGTLNVPAIVGLGTACEIALKEMSGDAERLTNLRNYLENCLLELDGVSVNGSREARLPHVANLAFGGLHGDALMIGIQRDLAVSSGSACTSASPEPSHVLTAMGVDGQLAHNSIRFALGRATTPEEINFAVEKIKKATHDIRQRQSEAEGSGIDAGTKYSR